MTCRFIDGFDYYATADVSRKYGASGSTSFTIIQSTIKRNGLNAISLQSALGFIENTFDNQASWIIGFAYRLDTFAGGTFQILQFKDAGTVQCSLRINADGTLEVLRGTSTTVTDGKSTTSIGGVIWHFIEMKVTIADSIGANTCKVRLNGADIITVATGQDLKSTANATANGFRIIGNSGSGQNCKIDDLYVFDGAGSKNNDFAGDCKVLPLHADGNGATSDFDGSDGNKVNNFEMVDETDTDDDTTYLESSTVGHIDLHTFENLPETPDTIHAVQLNNVAKKDDAGTRTIRGVARPTSTNFFGASKSPANGSYVNHSNIWEDDPQAAAAWSESTLNASEFGIEIET